MSPPTPRVRGHPRTEAIVTAPYKEKPHPLGAQRQDVLIAPIKLARDVIVFILC